MAVEIKETVHGTWLVNGVEVYENSEGKYEAKGLLLDSERKEFLDYIKKNDSKKIFSDLEHLKTDLKKIDKKIEMLKYQKELVDSRKDTFSEESIRLRDYYHKKLNKYDKMRNEIINNLPVTYQVEKVNTTRTAV